MDAVTCGEAAAHAQYPLCAHYCGATGKAPVDFGVATFGHAVALQPNGRIVVAGQRTGGNDFAVAHLLGSLRRPRRGW